MLVLPYWRITPVLVELSSRMTHALDGGRVIGMRRIAGLSVLPMESSKLFEGGTSGHVGLWYFVDT